MTLSKASPEDLKPQGCECGSGQNNFLIPYAPEKDELKAAAKNGTSTRKLMLPHKVELQVYMWTSRMPEQFLMHVQYAITAIWQKGLKEACKRLPKTKKE